MKINKEWHLQNKMPKNPTMEERIKWHKEHSKNCACHPTPTKLLAKMKKGLVVTKTEHEKWHKENGHCGNSKEHDACMKKWGITISKKKK